MGGSLDGLVRKWREPIESDSPMQRTFAKHYEYQRRKCADELEAKLAEAALAQGSAPRPKLAPAPELLGRANALADIIFKSPLIGHHYEWDVTGKFYDCPCGLRFDHHKKAEAHDREKRVEYIVAALEREVPPDLAVAAQVSAGARDEALKQFTEYFVANYPGPDTIIHDPKLHAPKIFRAAESALAAARGEGSFDHMLNRIAPIRFERTAQRVETVEPGRAGGEDLRGLVVGKIARWRHFAEQSGNSDWSDGISRCADELEAAIEASKATSTGDQARLREALEGLMMRWMRLSKSLMGLGRDLEAQWPEQCVNDMMEEIQRVERRALAGDGEPK